MTKEIGLFDLVSSQWEPLAAISDTHPRTIINDGMVLPGGQGVIFGTKDLKFAEPIAELYLFTPADRQLTRLTGGQTCSNGKVFLTTGNGPTLFDIDTPRRCVTRYVIDVNKRNVREDGIAIDLQETPGFPDGMCDCGDGTAIIGFYNPDVVPSGRAGRYRLDTGELVEQWSTPGSPRVTCPLLVEQSGNVKLILTTATEGMPVELREKCPEAGSLFIADTTFSDAPGCEVVRLT